MSWPNIPKKKYKLHCFNCGYDFYNKEEVFRVKYITPEGKKRSMPVCGDCLSGWAAAEVEAYEDEQWAKENPGVDREQEMIDEYHRRRYGEY